VNGRGEIRGTKWEDINGDGIRNNLIADSVAEFSGYKDRIIGITVTMMAIYQF
jgi:hypothetical protein